MTLTSRDPNGSVRCASLAAVRADAEALSLLFRTSGGEVPVTVPLDLRTAQALRHVHGLHGHTCHGAPDVHVGLLLRAVEAVGGAVTRVVVRPGAEPAFWLRVGDADGWTELDLDVLDAASLLLSRRVPVELVDVPEGTWDGALVALLAAES
jgi:hypothetical protein